MPRQDSKDRTSRVRSSKSRHPGRDIQEKTLRQESQDKTSRIGHQGKDIQAGQPGQDRRDRTVETGPPGKTARTTVHSRIGQLHRQGWRERRGRAGQGVQNSKDMNRTARTG
jgi:hypothetical protein